MKLRFSVRATFGGNPLASRTACTVLDIMQSEGLNARVEQTGERMFEAFRSRLQDHPGVQDIRGRGLMIGIELNQDVNQLKTVALDQGLLLNVTRNNVIRLLPPLIIDQDQADQIFDTVCKLIEALE